MEPFTPAGEYEKRRLEQQQRNRKRARSFSVVVGFFLLLALAMQVVPGLKGSLLADWLTLFAALGMACIYLGGRVWRWQRMQARLAPEVLASDPRPPVLYLRSFAADRGASQYEGRIASSLRELGPIIAVGRPEEKLPATIHIPRGYVAGEQWQDRVAELISRAQWVVLQIGTSAGLAWELAQVVRTVRPEQLLVCLGPKPRRKDPILRYQQFRAQYGELFPKGLPAEMQGSAFVAFGPDWTPIPSREVKGRTGDYQSWLLQGLHRRLSRLGSATPG
jgi:hypothetical protein